MFQSPQIKDKINEPSAKEFDEEEKRNTWDCSQDEVENEQSLTTLKGMIKNGEQEIEKLTNVITNTILVLGNAGAGKTTFVQFMAGDNTKLISKEILNDFGTYIIEDGNKIGTSVTESFTLYPEAVTFTTNSSLTDTPGFKDTRSEQHEIVESYVMKKYLKNFKNIKIALIITYNSLEKGSYKDDFISLLQNLNSFMTDVDKYKESVALIATKVPNMYKTFKSNVSLISDEQIISSIGEYLINVKQSIIVKLKEPNKVKHEKFYKNAIKLIDSLLEKDENSHYKKINIFRRPLEGGALSEMPLLQKEKESLKKTINNLNYSEIFENNVGYTLSEKAVNYLHCLSWYINEKISKISLHIFNSLKKRYESKIKKYTDIYTLHSQLEETLQKLKSLKNDLKLSKNYKIYSSRLDKYLVNENILSDQMENSTFLDFELHEYINSLQQFTNTSKILSTITWTEQMKNLVQYVKENLSWYKFLIKTFEYSSTYEIQNMKSKYFNTTNVNEEQNDLEKKILTEINWYDGKSDTHFNILALDGKRKNEINSIFTLTLKEHVNITCKENRKLIIQGNYIKFSEINSEKIVRSHCENINITAITINAIHTIFIDADFNNKYFKGVDIMIAAPRWEIIGSRIINIDGRPGMGYGYGYSAKDGENFVDDGEDGKPGKPGGNGGNFLGIGLHFINEGNLIISANGGAGGPGQNGGRGHKGKKGNEGYEKFYDYLPNDYNYNDKWTKGTEEFPFTDKNWQTQELSNKTFSHGSCMNEIFLYTHDGDCGEPGGIGGDGGVGGMGGYNGTVILIGEKESPKFITHNLPGITGNPGIGGYGGQPGENGKSVTCFKLHMHYSYENGHSYYWKCTSLANETIECGTPLVLNGIANHSVAGIEKPSEPNIRDFSSDLFSYTQLLKDNENNKFLVHLIKKLQSQIYKKMYSMKNLFWRFIFVQETTPILEQETTILPIFEQGTTAV